MITDIDAALLEKIADLTGKPVGAFNIRKDSGCEARQSTEHIAIDPRSDGKSGIDIRIKPGTKGEKCYIPVIISHSGLSELVYNDFYVGDDCDVDIIAGCGIHNCGEQGTAGGRRPNIYGLNPYAGYFVGVDLRKDSVMMAAINFKGQLIDETTVDFLMDNDPRSLDRLCDVIQNFIRARKIARDKVLAVGVNISGRVNSQTGYSYS